MSLIWDWIRRGVGFLWLVLFGGIGRMVTKVLSACAVTLVSLNAVLPQIKAFVVHYASSLPGPATQLLGALGFDVFMTMILSAVVVRFSFTLIPMPTAVARQLGVIEQ